MSIGHELGSLPTGKVEPGLRPDREPGSRTLQAPRATRFPRRDLRDSHLRLQPLNLFTLYKRLFMFTVSLYFTGTP